VCFSIHWIQWKRHVCSLLTIETNASPNPKILQTALKFSWTLSTMKPLKFGFFNPCFSSTFTSEDCIKHCKLASLNYMSQNDNNHHTTICHVINMRSHYGPSLNYTFDVIKHDPCILEVPTMLHLPHQVNTTCRAICWHLKKIHLKWTLAHEHIFLDI